MWKGISYFSIAVTNINKGTKLYQDMFGLEQMTSVNETRWGFRAAMMGDGKTAFMEIIEPVEPDSALARFMKEKSRPENPHGEGVYLIGVEVDDLEATVKHIRNQGGKITQEPELPDIAWVHPLTMRFAFLELHRESEQQD